MLWFLVALLPNCLALLCYNCRDYMGTRSVCGGTNTCTGTSCLYVSLNNSNSFVATCYQSATPVADFCWSDATNRTLCSCSTDSCNTVTGVMGLNTTTNSSLPTVSIDVLLSPDPGAATTTAATITPTVANDGGTGTPVVTTVATVTTTKSTATLSIPIILLIATFA